MPESMPVGRRGFLAALGGVALAPASDWPSLRQDFLFAPGTTYLNCGALGPSPRQVLERAEQAWRLLETNPSVQGYGSLVEAMDEVRTQAASLLGCSTEELSVTESTTAGMNAVAQGLDLRAGDRVLTSDQEHEGGRACWRHLARRIGVAVDAVALPGGVFDAGAIVERFAAAFTPRTRVLSVSHVTFATGLRLPVAELSALARSHGCVSVVDGAQAAGAIEVDVAAIGCDAYATSGHKWLLGPKGTGLLYIRTDPGRRIDPMSLDLGPSVYTGATGVRNVPGILGLGAALAYVQTAGLPAVTSRAMELRNRMYEALEEPRLRILSPPPGPSASPLLAFEIPEGTDSAALAKRLQDVYGLTVKPLPPPWSRGIRVSTHFFNSEADVERLVRVLRDDPT